MADLGTFEQVNAGVRKQPGLVVFDNTWSGPYEALKTVAESLLVGDPAKASSSMQGITFESDCYVCAVDLRRQPGGRALLTVTTSRQEAKVVWGLEMTEIQKPIKTWKANDPSDPPNLTQIKDWELQKSINRTAWSSFLYDGSNAMTGNTLKLAQMIANEGIEAYVVYTPVITRTTRLNTCPEGIGEKIGKIVSSIPSGDVPAKLFATQTSWLKTTDRLTGALDGTFTRVEAWTGADSWNEDLYETEA